MCSGFDQCALRCQKVPFFAEALCACATSKAYLESVQMLSHFPLVNSEAQVTEINSTFWAETCEGSAPNWITSGCGVPVYPDIWIGRLRAWSCDRAAAPAACSASGICSGAGVQLQQDFLWEEVPLLTWPSHFWGPMAVPPSTEVSPTLGNKGKEKSIRRERREYEETV